MDAWTKIMFIDALQFMLTIVFVLWLLLQFKKLERENEK